jgi:hypothetical protein
MTNILTMASDGNFAEADHASASKALAVASDGAFIEVAASGTRTVLALAPGGDFAEIEITFGGPGARQFLLPGYGFVNTAATRRRLLAGYGYINEVG